MTAYSKYSDQFVDWLIDEGYTHCFFVGGGNIMHLLDSVRSRLVCVPFVHEVGATIAAEFFNAAADPGTTRAFVLVTAGPGVTNTMTGVASAWGESRELLVIGGQVKASDLSRGEVRLRGLQELNLSELMSSVCKRVLRIETPMSREVVIETIRDGARPRKGPVFIEFCLDAQAAAPVPDALDVAPEQEPAVPRVPEEGVTAALEKIAASTRPVILLGLGVSREVARSLSDELATLGIPIMFTWNGADRLPSDHPMYAGRPNTWGQRAANIAMQQADLLIAVGSRLSIQQTGFAYDEFIPVGEVIQVDIDERELHKGHPRVELPLCGDAEAFLLDIVTRAEHRPEWEEWVDFVKELQRVLPLDDPQNTTAPGYVDPYPLQAEIANIADENDVLIPGSSGAAYTVAMQTLSLRGRQKLLSNKQIASMGYGLCGAIGASLANPGSRTFLMEGDGGFAQNIQELGTVAINQLPIKIFLFNNDGYASIRQTQRNYFDGRWLGCDRSTGVGLPDWARLAATYDIPHASMDPADPLGGEVARLLASDGPAFIEVPVDPDQTYYPRIASSVTADGSMRSNPLHRMSPDLPDELAETVFKYLTLTGVNR